MSYSGLKDCLGYVSLHDNVSNNIEDGHAGLVEAILLQYLRRIVNFVGFRPIQEIGKSNFWVCWWVMEV